MTKIILEGQDALNYIEMLNRIKELEALVQKQTPLGVSAEVKSYEVGIVPEKVSIKPIITNGKKEFVAINDLSQAIDEEMPKQEAVHRTDLPKDFVHGIEELPIKPEPTPEPVPLTKTPLEEWFEVVDSGFRYECANKHWLEYETVAIKLAVDRTSEYYHSIATLSKVLGRTEDALKIKARTMGYKTKKGMIKS